MHSKWLTALIEKSSRPLLVSLIIPPLHIIFDYKSKTKRPLCSLLMVLLKTMVSWTLGASVVSRHQVWYVTFWSGNKTHRYAKSRHRNELNKFLIHLLSAYHIWPCRQLNHVNMERVHPGFINIHSITVYWQGR